MLECLGDPGYVREYMYIVTNRGISVYVSCYSTGFPKHAECFKLRTYIQQILNNYWMKSNRIYIYILLDVLVYNIAVYFYEFCSILTSPQGESKCKEQVKICSDIVHQNIS